jgi:GNAT superfamily N-acetyltransferase
MDERELDLQEVSIRRADLSSEAAIKLISGLNRELSQRYPEDGANHFRLDAEEVDEGRGTFLIAHAGAEPLGCGAVRRIGAGVAEIKRMYVTPHARGQGLGRKILVALQEEARGLGATRILLETGDSQPEAIALYSRAGFVRIPPFGEYVDSPLSVCMAKDL